MRDGRFVQIDRPAGLILSPADGYVAAFTRDVPRGRVLTAGDIADAGRDAAATDRAVSAATLLDDLLPCFVGGARALSVTDASSRFVGSVSYEAVIAAIATPKAAP
jgi:glycine betaine/proline transport system ATP-binding protein